MTDQILKQIKDMGYLVSEHYIDGIIEMGATKPGSTQEHIARCNDGDGEEERYRCACLLAASVGLEQHRIAHGAED